MNKRLDSDIYFSIFQKIILLVHLLFIIKLINQIKSNQKLN